MKLWSDDEKPRQLYIVLIRYISTQLTIVNFYTTSYTCGGQSEKSHIYKKNHDNN
jgi:hypothetical protein